MELPSQTASISSLVSHWWNCLPFTNQSQGRMQRDTAILYEAGLGLFQNTPVMFTEKFLLLVVLLRKALFEFSIWEN